MKATIWFDDMEQKADFMRWTSTVCKKCDNDTKYSEKHDAYYCIVCNEWKCVKCND